MLTQPIPDLDEPFDPKYAELQSVSMMPLARKNKFVIFVTNLALMCNGSKTNYRHVIINTRKGFFVKVATSIFWAQRSGCLFLLALSSFQSPTLPSPGTQARTRVFHQWQDSLSNFSARVAGTRKKTHDWRLEIVVELISGQTSCNRFDQVSSHTANAMHAACDFYRWSLQCTEIVIPLSRHCFFFQNFAKTKR